jgi:vitamin B12 transporter
LGTQETKELGVSYSTKGEKLGFAINLNHFSTDGGNISRSGSEVDGYRNTNLNAKVQYDINDSHQLKGNIRFVEFTSAFDAIDFATTGLPTDADNISEGEQLSYLLSWLHAPKASNWSQSLSYQLSRNESENYAQNIFSGSTYGETERLAWIHYFDFSRGEDNSQSFLNVGIDAVEEDFKQAGPIGFGDPNQSQSNTTISALADGQVGLSEALYLSASLRRDNSDEFEDVSSFRLGLSWQLSPNLKIFLSRGKAIKNPSFTERFGFFPGTFKGNSSLTPESSFSNEIGLEYSPTKQIDIQLTHFDTELEDEINGFVFDPASGAFTASNIEETSTRKGLELSLKGYFERLTWSASYAYLEAEAPTEIELRRARHTGSATIDYAINDKNNMYIQGDYTGSKLDRFFPPFPASAEIVDLGAYWLLSANYSYTINERLQLNLRAENLLDEDYEDVFGFVGQKRRITLNLRYQLN